MALVKAIFQVCFIFFLLIFTQKQFYCFFSIPFQIAFYCVALQTHINDVMLRCYSKACHAAVGSVNGDFSNNFKPSSVEFEKRVQDLSKAVEESQRNADQVSF